MYFKQTILDLINNNIRNKFPKVIKAEHAQIEEALLDSIFLPYEVKQLDCPQEFIDDNFDLAPGTTMGLGKNLMVGFAMSNGNNGTKDRRKRISVGYDPAAYVSGLNFSIIGNPIGSADSVLAEHSHDVAVGNINDGNPGDYIEHHTARWDRGSGTLLEGTTTMAGVSAEDGNYPPAIVTLIIQRI